MDGVPLMFFEELANIKYSHEATDIIGFAMRNRHVPHETATFENRAFKLESGTHRLINFEKVKTSYIDTFKQEVIYRHGLFRNNIDYENIAIENSGLFSRFFVSKLQQCMINETFVFYDSNDKIFEFQTSRSTDINSKHYIVQGANLISTNRSKKFKKLTKYLKHNTINIWEDFEIFWFKR
jgi:hypothetical protein